MTTDDRDFTPDPDFEADRDRALGRGYEYMTDDEVAADVARRFNLGGGERTDQPEQTR
jgi:hypothetical protein